MSRAIFIFSICFLFAVRAYSRQIIEFAGQEDFHLKTGFLEYLEDPQKEFTIEDISSLKFDSCFKPIPGNSAENNNASSAYWLRFTIKNPKEQILLESFNFRINHLQLYLPEGDGGYSCREVGDLRNFSEREIYHKNFQFLLPQSKDSLSTYYLRFEHSQPTRLFLVLRSYSRFTSYAVTEYLVLGIFYGIILFLGLYNFCLYFSIKDKTYIFYVLYILSVGLYCLCQDGLGFQFLWPSVPWLNQHMYPIALYLMVSWMLMYTKSFLISKNNFPVINQTLNTFLTVRTVVFLLEMFFFPEVGSFLFLDIIAFLFVYGIAIFAYTKGFSSIRFFIFGFTVLFISFILNALRNFNILESSHILVTYILNIGALTEMIFLSMALAERIRIIKRNERLNLQLSRELELKVKERTEAISLQKKIIREKKEELDTFLYKASHDIKGPLKSIIGLASVGLKDKPENGHQYFHHIEKSAKKLDNIIMELLLITRINRSKVQNSEINFQETVDDILDTLSLLDAYKKITFTVHVEQNEKFWSEKSFVNSIFRNLIENGVKYRDDNAKRCFMDIVVEVRNDEALLIISDNGIGIPKELQCKVFEMFFRVKEKSSDSTGLGLYIVKISVEKLGGTIQMTSEEGKGTTFTIRLPNARPLINSAESAIPASENKKYTLPPMQPLLQDFPG